MKDVNPVRNSPAYRTGRECGLRNVNAQHSLRTFFAKVLRTPYPELRACSRLFSIICIALLLGCGYRLVGKETHVPPGLDSIAIPTFVNHTFEPGIEIPFTQAFLREFIQDRRVKIVDRGVADSYLEGVIKSFYVASVSYNRSGFVDQYLAVAVVDLTMKKRTGETLWKESNLSEKGWYRASSSVLVDQSNRDIAIQQIGKLLAERIRDRIFHNF